MKKFLLLTALLFTVAASLHAQSSLTITLLENQSYTALENHPLVIENQGIGYREERRTNEFGKVTLNGLSTSG